MLNNDFLSSSAIRRPTKGATTGTIIGAILGVIILLALIATAVVLIRKHRNKKDADGPPNYKPPPPKKSGSIEALNTSRGNVAESQPLSNLYYETNGEPAANLDAYSDRDPGYDDYPAPAGAPSGVDELPEPHYPGDEAPDEIDEPPYDSPPDENFIEREEEAEPHPLPNRGESFMSPAMYV
ncbi:hypothetical protein GJAV_G00006120 [Gymnothorax javanicus]|nr:hypothetical protein GJAV_G00006120 [Gymnothorax javanicus]